MGKPIRQGLLAGGVQVAIDVDGGLDIAMPHPLLNILQTEALIQQKTCAAMPLRKLRKIKVKSEQIKIPVHLHRETPEFSEILLF